MLPRRRGVVSGGGGSGSGSGSAGADPGPTISRADALAKLAEAYSLLYASVFVPGQPYLFCCGQPRYCPTVYPGWGGRRWGGAFRPDQLPSGPTTVRTHYNSSVLRRAWELLVEAVPACGGSANSAITYDLGAICFGSLLVAIIQTINAIVLYLQAQAEKHRACGLRA